MASACTHAAAAIAIGTAFRNPGPPARFWVMGAAFAALPDLDGIGFWLGIPYESDFGHRGFSHSLFFAALLACAGLVAFRGASIDRARAWLFLFLATASHGVLDAMTSGGGGVAFFAPFHDERYFFPWRPILVSPMSVRHFFSERGIRILASEMVWVWIPAAVGALIALAVRNRRRDSGAGGRFATGTHRAGRNDD
jgi:inner membrane protein